MVFLVTPSLVFILNQRYTSVPTCTNLVVKAQRDVIISNIATLLEYDSLAQGFLLYMKTGNCHFYF